MEELQRLILDLERRVQQLENEQKLSYRQILRLTNALQGSKTYYVPISSPTGPTKAVTFKDGILSSEV